MEDDIKEDLIEQEEIEQEEVGQDGPTPEELEEVKSLEEEAKKYGWKPKTEFDLEPEGWVDAEKFLSFPKTQVRMFRDNNRELKRQLEEVQNKTAEELERIRSVNKKAIERAREQERSRATQEIENIRQQKAEAVRMADEDAYKALDDRERGIREDLDKPVVNEPPAADPLVEKYRKENEWTQNPLLWQEAIQAVGMELQRGPMSTERQIEFAESVIKDKYPHKFEKPAPQQRQRVDPGGLGAGAGRGRKGASDLPREAQSVGREYVEEGIYKSLDEYAKDYWAQEA